MITQNLFSTRPKTFMDYKPGKVPDKNKWNEQTTAKTKMYDPFASNVKLVGDDMTEKDYDTFFEGFRSLNGEPLWKEPKLRNELKTPTLTKRVLIETEAKGQTDPYDPASESVSSKHTFPKIPSFGIGAKTESFPYRPLITNEANIQFLPYLPSTDGEANFQPLPYIPAKDGQARVINYSATVPQNIQAKNTSQKTEETFREKGKEYIDDLQNFGGEIWKIAKDLPTHIYPAMVAVITLPPGNPLRMVAVKVLEAEVKKIHYGRNQYNVDLPTNADEAKELGWKTVAANCHQFTAPEGEKYEHIKYISPDGKREVIFDYTGTKVITADEDVGTYNYADPDLKIAHSIVDILPWILYGNTPEDTTKLYQRIGGLFNFEK